MFQISLGRLVKQSSDHLGLLAGSEPAYIEIRGMSSNLVLPFPCFKNQGIQATS